MAQTALIHALRSGPKTNAELADLTCDHGGGVSRSMAKLIADGRAKRIDGNQGRGSIALYALAGRP